MLPETLNIPPGQDRRETIAFLALSLALGLALCAAMTVLHFLLRY